ncbi:MAG: hypothetical protein LQ345_002456 [Seirophora villosa]|nr:MAG: hypothetical protein LQ345_002456 [Seirophora villosa]
MEQHVLELRFDLKSTDMISIYKHVMATLHRRLDPAIMQKAARYYSLSALLRQQAIKSFEAAKVAFRDDAEQHDFYVNLPGVGDIQDAGVRSGNFHISREEMRALFDPVIDRIINLISSQIQGSIDRQFHPRNWWVRRIRVPIPALVQ